MEAGRYGTINELAAAEKINSSYVSRLLRLTLLAPGIVEAILDGRQPVGMTLQGLMEPLPVEWALQLGLFCGACQPTNLIPPESTPGAFLPIAPSYGGGVRRVGPRRSPDAYPTA